MAIDPHTALFQQHRPRLFGLAYRMLGTPADAEDVLHDAWLRWHGQAVDIPDDAEAWLVTVTTRLALDRLRRAKAERERYTGPWLPEPLAVPPEAPEEHLQRAETLGLSFLALLERLGAGERAAFLLHEVFDYSHAEAAAMLGIVEATCRQRVRRAKARLREGRPRFHPDPQTCRRLLERFAAALERPDPESLRALFAEDAVHVADGGGTVQATLRPLHGAERLARLYLQIGRGHGGRRVERLVRTVNGEPVLLQWLDDALDSVTWIEASTGSRIAAVYVQRHPGKLARLGAVTNPAGNTSLQGTAPLAGPRRTYR